ncbi:MAG: type VI secretion system baseplate subunit TssG [Cyclobacteriaceae bacterium]|nr:type VI secretion system baseplate subunit TssG [Cyclobacteriaceae bacterium]
MRNFDKIVASINHLRHDIKAEAIIADIMENGLNEAEIVTIPDGLFKRRFKQDISKAETRELNNGEKVLEIHITRDGIYDALPAGLFHDEPKESVSKGRDMASHSKNQRLIEQEARKFFQPFENEIFLKHVDLELEERKILNRFSENLFDDIFSEFWKLDRSLPHIFLARMILMLHLAHKITGNLEMTARTLEIIIEETVKVNLISPEQSNKVSSHMPIHDRSALGFSELGKSFICGNHVKSFQPVLQFVFGPLRNTSVEDYLENGQIFRFLDCFFGYFVPVEMDVSTKVLVDKEEMDFSLDPISNPILGYNSTI